MKNLNQTSFPNRAVKTFSIATHLFRGIILFSRKSLWWGTSDSMKLSTRDYVCPVAPLSSWSAAPLAVVVRLRRWVVLSRVLVLGTWLSRPLPTHIMSSWARGGRVA